MTTTAPTPEILQSFVQACCTGDKAETLRILGEHPDAATWHDPTRLRRSPLIEVVISGKHVDIAELLIEHGCDVNWQDDKGQTALHHVMEITCGDLALIPLLVKAGTDEKLRDENTYNIEAIARMFSTPPYKEALKTALAERAELRQQQQVTAADLAQAAAELCTRAINHHATLIQSRKLRDGARFKL